MSLRTSFCVFPQNEHLSILDRLFRTNDHMLSSDLTIKTATQIVIEAGYSCHPYLRTVLREIAYENWSSITFQGESWRLADRKPEPSYERGHGLRSFIR